MGKDPDKIVQQPEISNELLTAMNICKKKGVLCDDMVSHTTASMTRFFCLFVFVVLLFILS